MTVTDRLRFSGSVSVFLFLLLTLAAWTWHSCREFDQRIELAVERIDIGFVLDFEEADVEVLNHCAIKFRAVTISRTLCTWPQGAPEGSHGTIEYQGNSRFPGAAGRQKGQ